MLEEQVIFTEGGHALGGRGRVVVQVRAASLTLEVLERVVTGMQLWNAKADVGVLRGILAIVCEDAGLPSGALALAQRSATARAVAQSNVFIALVLEGAGVGHTAKRAFYRLLFRTPRRELFADVDRAIPWLTEQIQAEGDAKALATFAGTLRRQALASRP
jgi:hypothetical protein